MKLYSPVWVLVIPSSSNAYISVTGSASSSSSTSSDNTILIAILVPISISWAIVILIIIWIIVIKVIRNQKIIKIENNPADDNIEITSSAPVPQSQPRRSVNHTHQLQILNEEVIYPPSRHLTYVINSSRANYRPEMPVKNYEYNPEDPNFHQEVIETGVPIYQSKYN